MAFDSSPSTLRTTPACDTCPVPSCPARSGDVAACWRSLVDLLPSQMPGRNVLIEAGATVSSLYSVRAGCIKSYTLDAEGNEHIRAFHFPGDLVGLDALGCARAPAAAAPVTPSQVCAVPMADVTRRLATDAALAGHLLQKTREALQQSMAMAGEFTAEQRVAAFLLNVHTRIGSGAVVRLPMTRREIGSYLRLATETVCRVITRFERQNWLSSADKRITLRDLTALRTLAEPIGLSG